MKTSFITLSIIVLYALACSKLSIADDASTTQGAKTPSENIEDLKASIILLDDSISRIQKQIGIAQDVLDKQRIKQGRCSAPHQLQDTVTTRLESLRDCLKTLKADTPAESNAPPVDLISRRRFITRPTACYYPYHQFMQSVRSPLEGLPKYAQLDDESDAILSEIYGSDADEKDELVSRRHPFPDTNEMFTTLDAWVERFEGAKREERATMLKTVDSATQGLDLPQIQKRVDDAISLYCKPFDAIVARATKKLEDLRLQLAKSSAARQSSSAKIESLTDAKKEQDKGLTYAIYAMILVLLAIFIATRFFDKQVQLAIISNRTLVEVIGLAFLLLTLIVLGTGEKIEKPVLGTLLGSIGGYIFGAQSRSQRHDVESDQDTSRGRGGAPPPSAASKSPVRRNLEDTASGSPSATIDNVTPQASSKEAQRSRSGTTGSVAQPGEPPSVLPSSEGGAKAQSTTVSDRTLDISANDSSAADPHDNV